MKSYTDLGQSKKLAKILPSESADMCWTPFDEKWDAYLGSPNPDAIKKEIQCWSLAALLDVLPKIHGLKPILDLEEISIQYSGVNDGYVVADNPVDACVDMIERLHELNLL